MKTNKKSKSFKAVFCAVLLAVLGAGLASCSTTKGLGRDLQKLGSEIEEEAQENGY